MNCAVIVRFLFATTLLQWMPVHAAEPKDSPGTLRIDQGRLDRL